MSKFKRSFLSPQQFYKSIHTSPLKGSSSESRNERHQKPASQLPSLQLCRGSSIIHHNAGLSKENRPPHRLVQPVSSNERGCSYNAECDENCSAYSEHETLLWEPRSSRKPLASLPENVSELCHQTETVRLEIRESGEITQKIPSFTAPPTPIFAPPTPNRTLHVWDDEQDYDVAPASSWSALGNRYLLCRPLPLDVGRCACYIVHEREAGVDGPVVYSLYTDEGHGRQDRRLAVARHRRRAGRSEFIIAQDGAGTSLTKNEESFLGRVSANIIGSRYHIWDEASSSACTYQGGRQLLGVVMFEPTITTLTGTFRVMRAYVPKYQSLHMSNTTQHEPIGLARNWEENTGRVHELCSRKPFYNRELKRYELDYRDRTRSGYKIQTSSKNFQLIMEEHGKQIILLHGKVSNSKYIMEYRFPLTAYQAFGICLASIDSKLCCYV
ncbi:hypothetical protein KP509_03G003600 [Ceratopteris richardii]|uniref:Tubby C-terminal domain-containing protein n=1 Tax=Ceratopteris richardii TaxID=49495 RepID=A0A8T2V489_CERRI|nr:hypothetical protein KP509_03G003600 [Ceratopteris richardii]KAH7440644.1 hypothetical protein KP509_03G003600 [Ceratopteris richardii]